FVSFAGSFKSLFVEWFDWEERFDTLLSQLYSRSALVRLDDEVVNEFQVLEYVCEDGWNEQVEPGRRKWRKWRTDENGVTSEENRLRLPGD
ncbi:MAG: hypothetical protein N2C14_32490, partial [Planctomycetales bacterium]